MHFDMENRKGEKLVSSKLARRQVCEVSELESSPLEAQADKSSEFKVTHQVASLELKRDF